MRHILLSCLMACLCLSLLQAQTFSDSAAGLGINHNFFSAGFAGGLSFVDFNDDGWDDLTLAADSLDTLAFYQNMGGYFMKLDPPPILELRRSQAVLWVDFDNDGDKDLYVANFRTPYGSRLYRRDSAMSFTDVTVSAGLPIDTMGTVGACFGDYDKDGDLDLYMTTYPQPGEAFTNYLYRNNNDGTFTDVTSTAGVGDPGKLPFGASFLDYDNDGWEDIYVYQDKTGIENTLFHNNGDGTFTDLADTSGANLSIDAMSNSIADYDYDGDLDIYNTNSNDGNKLLTNNGDGTFTEMADTMGVGFYGIGWGSNWVDYENDGDLDLFAVGEYSIPSFPIIKLYQNNGSGPFTDITSLVGMVDDTLSSNFSSALGDFNNDGYYDIAVQNTNPGNLDFWANSGGSRNWIKVELEGTVSNRDGIGSWIEIWTSGKMQTRYTQCGADYLGQNSQYMIVGLDTATVVDSLVIRWQMGTVDRYEGLCVNTSYHFIEGDTTAVPEISPSTSIRCPYDSVAIILFVPDEYETYIWSTGDTTALINVDSSGTYSVTVTDEYCQMFSDEAEVFDSDLSVSTSHTDVLAGTSNTGTASALPLGGFAPYTYLWNDSLAQTDSTATGLSAGTYTVCAWDSVGCEVCDTVMVGVEIGIQEPAGHLVLSIYPNPVSEGPVIIQSDQVWEKEVMLQLLNSKGQWVHEFRSIGGSTELELEIPKLPEGLYFLKIGSGMNERILRLTILSP